MTIPAEGAPEPRKRNRHPKSTEGRLAYSVPEAAKALGIGESTLWRWIRDGAVTAAKIGPNGGRTIISAETLKALVSGKAAA
jgi:excisionase family DNA binding protein